MLAAGDLHGTAVKYSIISSQAAAADLLKHIEAITGHTHQPVTAVGIVTWCAPTSFQDLQTPCKRDDQYQSDSICQVALEW